MAKKTPLPTILPFPIRDHTHVLRGQELHAIGHLVAEAHEVCVAKHRRIIDQGSPIGPFRGWRAQRDLITLCMPQA